MLNRTNIIEKLLNQKNKLDHTPDYYIPTPYECAALSYDTYKYEKVYHDTVPYWKEKEGYPPLPAGWKRYAISKPTHIDHDYCGACYIKYDQYPVAVVFANRGTDANKINNLLDCLKILQEKMPLNSRYAVNFLNDTYDEMDNDNVLGDRSKVDDRSRMAKITYTFTGHSLGGYSADFQYMLMAMGYFDRCFSITFDNPGSYNGILNALLNDDDQQPTPEDRARIEQLVNSIARHSYNYVAHSNFINTCNKHLGNIYLLKDLSFTYYLDERVLPSVIIPANITANVYYFLYSLNQHSMSNILKYIQAGQPIYLDNNHAIGLLNGFKDYLNLEKHKLYWMGYIQYVWAINDLIRQAYNDEFEPFLNDMYENIRKVHDKASELTIAQEPTKEQQKLLTSSNLGLFCKKQKEIAKDFVIVNRNNPSVYTQEQYKKKGCSIM